MYKKAGILFGLTCIVITIIVFFFLGKIEKNIESPNSEVPKNSSVILNTNTSGIKNDVTDKNNVDNNNIISDVEKETFINNETDSKSDLIIKETSSITTINESDLQLNEKTEVKEVIVYIENKRLVLLDESPNTPNNKMLVYCFDTTSPNGEKLVLYMTKTAYDDYSVGDKLSVVYQVYINDVGTKIPVIYSVTALE